MVLSVLVVAVVVGVLEGVDRLHIHHCRWKTIPTVDRTLTKEEVPCVES